MSLEKGSKTGREEGQHAGGGGDAASTLGDLARGRLGSLDGRGGGGVVARGGRGGGRIRGVRERRASGGGRILVVVLLGRGAGGRRRAGRRSGAGAGGRGRGGGRGLRDEATGHAVGGGAGDEVHAVGAAPGLALLVGRAEVSGVARVWERVSGLALLMGIAWHHSLPEPSGQQSSPAVGLKQWVWLSEEAQVV